jgi:hypothetical protein
MQQPVGDDEVALLFTGGLDTTLAALRLAERYRRVHLLTFDNGLCLGTRAFPRRRVEELHRLLGDAILHRTISVRETFRHLRADLLPLIRRYHTPQVIDQLCKLSMEVGAVVYCLEHGVAVVADGASPFQTEFVLQTADYGREVERFMASYRIATLAPGQTAESREERRRILRDRGLDSGLGALSALQRLGLNMFSDQLGNQPVCLASAYMFWLTSPWHDTPLLRPFKLTLAAARELRARKEPEVRELIRAQLGGLDLEAVIRARPPVQVDPP